MQIDTCLCPIKLLTCVDLEAVGGGIAGTIDFILSTGMLSHQLKQHVIDGEKTIIQNPTDQQK